MTTDEKQLLLRDLCARLPYGVKFREEYKPSFTPDDNPVSLVEANLYNARTLMAEKVYRRISSKIVLFPISCISQEITVNGETFVPIVELAKIAEPVFFTENGLNISDKLSQYGCGWLSHEGIAFAFAYFPEEKSFFICNENKDRLYMENMAGLFDKLNEWHINYRLPDHLFVPVTEEFNPYK